MRKTALYQRVLEVLKDKPTEVQWVIEVEPSYVSLTYNYLPWDSGECLQILVKYHRQGKLSCDFYPGYGEYEHLPSLEQALERADFFFKEMKTHLSKESYGIHRYE